MEVQIPDVNQTKIVIRIKEEENIKNEEVIPHEEFKKSETCNPKYEARPTFQFVPENAFEESIIIKRGETKDSKDRINPIRACGIIIYTIRDGKKYFLLSTGERGLEDFGGKTDKKDKNARDVAIREFMEETQGRFIDQKTLENLFNDEGKRRFYVPRSKYIIYFLRYDQCFFEGKINYHDEMDSIHREVAWYHSLPKMKEELQPRLKNEFGELLKIIDSI